MSTISTEQAKDLRNAFECWQQDYDPVEDKEQYEMFGLGVVAMDELLALRKERERAEPVVKAAEKLVRCKGRYHSEQNYRALAALFGVTTPDLPPLEGEASPTPVVPEAVIKSLYLLLRRSYFRRWVKDPQGYVSGSIPVRDLVNVVLFADACRAAMLKSGNDEIGSWSNLKNTPTDKPKSEMSQKAEQLLRDTTALAEKLSAETDTTSQQFESLAGRAVVTDENGNLPCPFCGGRCDPNGWMGSYDDGVPMCGPECEDCGATANSIEEWNRRTTALAGKAVGGSDGFECTPVADLYELLTKCGECYDYTTSAKVAADWIKEGYSAREYVKLDRLQEALLFAAPERKPINQASPISPFAKLITSRIGA